MSKTPEIMKNPLTSKGTAFTPEERRKYGLTGHMAKMLPVVCDPTVGETIKK